MKITGAHDFNDYGVATRNRIPLYRLMDTKGTMRDDGDPYPHAAAEAQKHAQGWVTLFQGQEWRVGSMSEHKAPDVDALNLVPDDLRGLDRFEARKRVVDQITSEGLAVIHTVEEMGEDGETISRDQPLVENKPIMQPFGDRSKVVIEPMLTDQWFVDTDQIVGPAIDAVRSGETNIMPEQDRKVYFNWLENIEPWCISRQLWWGHQIPVWYGPDKDDLLGDMIAFCAPTVDEVVAKAQHYYGSDVTVESTDLAPNYAQSYPEDGPRDQQGQPTDESLFRLAGVDLVRDPDVLDTWFSSGLWPIGTLGWPEDTEELKKYFPTSVLVTGFDIIFFWVARMMMMQYAVVGQKPFDHVYVHALVRDEKGKKMSKSLGNVLDPLELIDEYGADAVRFTLTAMAAMGRDLKLSTQRIAGYRNFGTKLWNAARFAEMNGATTGQIAPTQHRSDIDAIPTPSQTVNTWIIGETARVREDVDHALNQFRFNDAANALYAFVWGKVCDWYVEFSKPLLMDGDEATKAETQATMAWVIDQCLILLHPIMPFITEELWGTLGEREKQLVHADWPTYGADLIDENADREMNWVISVIESIRSARQQVRVPAGLTIPVLCTDLDAAGKAAWARNEVMIKRLARIDSLTMTDTLPKGCITVAVDGGSFGLPLADVIDVKEEKARLEKTLGKLEKELGGLRGRLNNPKFVASAPEEVVEEARGNLALREEEEAKLRAAFSQLTELET